MSDERMNRDTVSDKIKPYQGTARNTKALRKGGRNMDDTTLYVYAGLDLEATGRRISRYIDESGLRDKELGARMRLSVQSINKWRHGHCLPDIENLFILSRILGVRVDDFLVASEPRETSTHHSATREAGLDPASCLFVMHLIHD